MSLDNLMDSKVEALCIKILTTDSEFWEARNKAVLSLTSLIMPYEGAESSRIQEVFNTNIFRLLKDPIKDIISDLRSQQIRDVCLFLIKLSEITRDHMKLLLREIFCFILDAVKVPNRVMSGYVDNAILTMIKNTIFKSCIPSLVSEIRDSKAKMVRERCLVSERLIFLYTLLTLTHIIFFTILTFAQEAEVRRVKRKTVTAIVLINLRSLSVEI